MFLWQSTNFATVLLSVNMPYTIVDWVSISFYIEFQFLVQCVSDSCLSFVYVLWVVILGLDIYIFWGIDDWFYRFYCTGFKRFYCGLVVVNYLCLLGINYFDIKINTISLRRTVLLCSWAVINLITSESTCDLGITLYLFHLFSSVLTFLLHSDPSSDFFVFCGHILVLHYIGLAKALSKST
jgi:hypothetical protein